MTISPIDILIRDYSFSRREKEGLTTIAKSHLEGISSENNHLLFIGYGWTISSGYSPTRETIIPLLHPPTERTVEYIKQFWVSQIQADYMPLIAKDSRDINDEDIYILLDLLALSHHRKICITLGTYLWPKITLILFLLKDNFTDKRIIITWSMLPAGFSSSDADINIWSAITLLNMNDEALVWMIFHGNFYHTEEDLRVLDLHPEESKDILIEYPNTLIPIKNKEI